MESCCSSLSAPHASSRTSIYTSSDDRGDHLPSEANSGPVTAVSSFLFQKVTVSVSLSLKLRMKISIEDENPKDKNVCDNIKSSKNDGSISYAGS